MGISCGFTLAEVLITLGIIGVVAALTLPNLIADYKNKELATRAKRSYSLITQAIQRWQADNGIVGDITGLFDTSKTSEQVTENFSKYFNIVHLCLDSSNECKKFVYNVKYAKILSNQEGNAGAAQIKPPLFVLNDGSLISITQYSSCNRTEQSNIFNEDGSIKTDADGNPILQTWNYMHCAEMRFDTNGLKGPNQYGADVFSLRVYEDGNLIKAGWDAAGFESLKNILNGGDPIYKKYNIGQKI